MSNNSFCIFHYNYYLCIGLTFKKEKIMQLHSIILAFSLLLAPISSNAQWHQRHPRTEKATDKKFLKKYTDSLSSIRSSIFSDSVSAKRIKRIDTAPYFLPLTFYRGIAHNTFAIPKDISSQEGHLLSIYLSRPDLVVNTQQNLEEAGPVLTPKAMTEKPVSIVSKSQPQEPEPLPVDVILLKPNFWNFGGDYNLQFIQNYLTDNWYQGGESNYSMLGAITFTANYNNKQKVRWDNTLDLKFGMQTSRSDTIHKMRPTEDLIRYTGKLGLQATKQWYYTFQLIGQTQFVRHYKSNTNVVQSDLFSPITVNSSIGMDYNVNWLKKKLTGSVHLAPLAYNFKYVGRTDLASSNGIDTGHHSLNDFGSQITLNLNWKFSDNISWKTRLYWYTTYERTEAEWENTFSFQFNRYLATKLFVYPRFDDARSRDDKLGYWMFKEYISLGFSFSM